jgi:hypothetical protein
VCGTLKHAWGDEGEPQAEAVRCMLGAMKGSFMHGCTLVLLEVEQVVE